MTDPLRKTSREQLLKIGEFARSAGTNLRTLRYYEELGLLEPALRSDGGFRYYRPTDVNRVRMIHSLQELGLHLEEIKGLLDTRTLPEEGEARREAWTARIRRALDAHRMLINERIELLQRQREQVQLAVLKFDSCATCQHQPAAENNFCEPCTQTGEVLPAYLSALF